MRKIVKRVVSLCCCVAMAASVTACGGRAGTEPSTKAAAAGTQEETVAEKTEAAGSVGGEITVMVPPWAEPSQELLDSFTSDTGIKVTMNVVGWDDIRNKVSIAAVGKKAPADVIEVDWSWVGEFGAADWLEPIAVTEDDKAGMPTVSSFQYGDNVIALPYANDYRLGYYNKEHFSKIGLDQAPDNWDDMIAACKKIKAEGICEYPLSVTLSATEAATTSLIWMTLSRYGDFFNSDFTVNQEHVLAALKSIDQIVNEDKLIDPASQNMKDVEVYGKLTSGDASFMVGPAYFDGRINNPDYSSVVGQLAPTLIPGNGTTKTATFALPEGIGISKFSENKEAALKFAQWYTSADIQLQLYQDKGILPTRTAALQKLIDDGIMVDGQVMIDQSQYISSPFPGGIPSWYAEMSNTIYNSVNQMVAGSLTPEQAYDKISAKVNELNQ